MALAIDSVAKGPGKGATRPLIARTPRVLELAIFEVDFDASYPTGGEAFDANAEARFSEVEAVVVLPKAGFVFEYVPSAVAADRKIKAYWTDADFAGDKQMIEVTNTTDLSAVTDVTVMVYGYRGKV